MDGDVSTINIWSSELTENQYNSDRALDDVSEGMEIVVIEGFPGLTGADTEGPGAELEKAGSSWTTAIAWGRTWFWTMIM